MTFCNLIYNTKYSSSVRTEYKSIIEYISVEIFLQIFMSIFMYNVQQVVDCWCLFFSCRLSDETWENSLPHIVQE